MRLGQLARKIGLRPVEIVDFLAQNNIEIDDNANAKLPDDQVAIILQKFAPALAKEIAAELDDPQVEAVDKISQPDNLVNENQSAPVHEAEIPGNEITEEVELIKAPKVELPGLKVVGKIELPEMKTKESLPESTESPASESIPQTEKKPREENRKPYPQRRERPNQPRKNPIALQREREATEAQRKRQEEAEREKEKRKDHYHKKVKATPPTKRVRMVDEPVEEFSAAELVPPPKTLWGKFKKWMKS